jgi:uncharacterized protein (TIGR02246 family)
MWKSITTIIMVFLALAGRSQAQESSPTDEQAVRGNVDAWMAAWNNGDATVIAQLVAEDYEIVLPDGTHIRGREAYEKVLASNVARRQGTASRSVTTVFVRFLKPDVAVASGTWTRSGGVAGPGKGSWLATYRKQDGKWLMASGLYAPAPP